MQQSVMLSIGYNGLNLSAGGGTMASCSWYRCQLNGANENESWRMYYIQWPMACGEILSSSAIYWLLYSSSSQPKRGWYRMAGPSSSAQRSSKLRRRNLASLLAIQWLREAMWRSRKRLRSSACGCVMQCNDHLKYHLLNVAASTMASCGVADILPSLPSSGPHYQYLFCLISVS